MNSFSISGCAINFVSNVVRMCVMYNASQVEELAEWFDTNRLALVGLMLPAMISIVYGWESELHKHVSFFLVNSAISILFTIAYAACDIYVASRRENKIKAIARWLLPFGFSVLISGICFLFEGEGHETTVGWIFVGASFISSLLSLASVFMTKEVTFISFIMPLFPTASGIIWLIYASMLHRPFVKITSITGIGTAFLQLIFNLVYYYCSSGTITPNEEADMEMGGVEGGNISMNSPITVEPGETEEA